MKHYKPWWKFVVVFVGLGLISAQSAQAQISTTTLSDSSLGPHSYAPHIHQGHQSYAPQQSYVPQQSYADYGDYTPAAAAAAPADAGPWTLFPNDKFDVGGWFQFGYHSESNDLFNDRPDTFNLQQGYFFFGKEAVSENGELDFGFRFDGVYGIDGPDTQSFGNAGPTFDNDPSFTRGATFGWAIPQLYVEAAKGDWSLKVGHFYTLVGYEVVPAADNFFYSHAITTFNTEPFTHTGAVATWNATDKTTVYGGWTAGWDSGFDFDVGSNFLGGFGHQFNDDVSFTYITTIGDFGLRSQGFDGYGQSMVLDMALTDRLNYVIQSDLLRVDETGEDNVGLVQNLFFDATERIGYGARIEWWKGDDITGYAPHGGLFPTSSTSYYAATIGTNYKLNKNLRIRPEYRYDWSPALGYDEGFVGIDIIGTY